MCENSLLPYAEGTKTQKLVSCVKLWYLVVLRFIEVLLFLPGFFFVSLVVRMKFSQVHVLVCAL